MTITVHFTDTLPHRQTSSTSELGIVLYVNEWLKKFTYSLLSSVAEHWSCKPGVVSSILTGGRNFIRHNQFIYALLYHYQHKNLVQNIL